MTANGSESAPEAGAPELEKLLADDAAIERMATRLLECHSEEAGGILLASFENSKALVRSLLLAGLESSSN